MVNSFKEGVADQMGQWAEKHDASFVVSLGDNFYQNGVTSVTDPLWDSVFVNGFKAKSLYIPWYISLGNHDWNGNVSAQLDYSRIHSSSSDWSRRRYMLPANYYTQIIDIDSDHQLELIILDTLALDYDSDTRLIQLSWLNATLAASSSHWLFVAGHHPVYSAGEHGDADFMFNDIKSLLEAHQVDAYICGHDHTLQHLLDNDIHYIVSGNAAKEDGTLAPHKHVLYNTTLHGFTTHMITANEMKVQYISHDGIILHEYTQTSRRYVPDTRPHHSKKLGVSAYVGIAAGAAAVLTLLAVVVHVRRKRAAPRGVSSPLPSSGGNTQYRHLDPASIP